MPVGAKTPMERLRAAKCVMNKLKDSPIAIVQNTFENVVGRRLPWSLTQQVAFDTFVRHTFVFSNVPVRAYVVCCRSLSTALNVRWGRPSSIH